MEIHKINKTFINIDINHLQYIKMNNLLSNPVSYYLQYKEKNCRKGE